MSDKQYIPKKLLWVDLEMTGLDSKKDVILEVAAEITDMNFQTLASYEARLKQDRDTVVKRMQANIWWKEFPANRDQFIDKLDEGKDPSIVEQELVALVKEQFGDDLAVLAGNSIHNDRSFITQWLPNLDLLLHYRMLDVSSWKLVMQSRYNVQFEKPDIHRAFDDIQASIAELDFYLDWFKRQQDAN